MLTAPLTKRSSVRSPIVSVMAWPIVEEQVAATVAAADFVAPQKAVETNPKEKAHRAASALKEAHPKVVAQKEAHRAASALKDARLKEVPE